MKLFRILSKTVNYFQYLILFGSHFLAYSFAFNNVQYRLASQFKKRKGYLVLQNGNHLQFPVSGLRRFNTPQIGYLLNLLVKENVSFLKSDENGVWLEIDGIKYRATSAANLSILNELISDHFYNITTASDLVMIDIGMNVGYASLYFSRFPSVKKIYSYEPFTDTVQIAKENFAANGDFGNKVVPHDYGVSNYTGSVKVPMLEGGSVIASTEDSFIKNHQITSTNFIEVKVRNILEILSETRQLHPDMPIGLKIDCEGEEYAILESMNKSNSFYDIKFLCIEWHFKGSDPIKKILLENGYVTFDIPKSEEGEFGMVYGFKS